MKNLSIILLFCFVPMIASAQNNNPKYTVPDEYSFVEPEDYDTFQAQISETIDWYLWRSMGFDSDKRQKASTFFLQWLIGSPTVSVEINSDIVNFISPNPELMLAFMMGWTKHALENNSNDKIEGNVEGIKTAVNYYNKNKGFLKKDKEIENYDKMIKKNKLEGFIKKSLNKKK